MRRRRRDGAGRRRAAGPAGSRWGGPPVLRSRPGLGLEGHDVLRGRALCALDHVELDLGALRKAPMALGLDGAVMAEDVLLAVVTRDGAEALRVVEALGRSRRTPRLLPLRFE